MLWLRGPSRMLFPAIILLAACHRGNAGSRAAADSVPPQPAVPLPPPEREPEDLGGLMLYFAQLPISSYSWADFKSLNLAPGQAGCPVVDTEKDSDGDGVPDQATYTFREGPCTIVAGGYRTVLTGTVTVRDPGAGFGYSAAFHGFRRLQTPAAGGPPLAITMEGTQVLAGPAAAPRLDVDVVTTWDGPPRSFNPHIVEGVTTLRVKTRHDYITDSGRPVEMAQPLGRGVFSIQGTVGLEAGERHYTLAITTKKQLRYSPYCLGGPSPFPGGELAAAATGIPGVKGFRIAYQVDCRDEMEFETIRAKP